MVVRGIDGRIATSSGRQRVYTRAALANIAARPQTEISTTSSVVTLEVINNNRIWKFRTPRPLVLFVYRNRRYRYRRARARRSIVDVKIEVASLP